MNDAGRVAGLILAAGKAERFSGEVKALLPFGSRTILESVAQAAATAGLDPVFTVIGHRAGTIRNRLAGSATRFVENPDFEEGQASSLVAGVSAVRQFKDIAALAVLLADEPGIRPDVIRRVMDGWRASGAAAARAVYTDRPGHPVVFDRAVFGRLAELGGDEGARAMLVSLGAAVREVRVDGPAPVDVDRPADYEEALRNLAREEARKTARP